MEEKILDKKERGRTGRKLKSAKKLSEEGAKKNEKPSYFRAIGRRKTSFAEVKFFPSAKEKKFLVNRTEANIYFPEFELQRIIFSPMKKVEPNLFQRSRIEVITKGGGKRGQSEAIRLAISRALVLINPKFKEILKSQGYLSRDPRMVERKKFGLKKARKAPQWAKR